MDYPDDADGDVLRAVSADGADMSRPMEIDFTIAAPTLELARSLAERIAALGYSPRIFEDPTDKSVSLYCAKTMMATYDEVMASQKELNNLCLPLGAECDGWLTAGNRQGN